MNDLDGNLHFLSEYEAAQLQQEINPPYDEYDGIEDLQEQWYEQFYEDGGNYDA